MVLSDFAIAARPVTYTAYGLEYAKLAKFYEQVATVEKMDAYVDEDIRLAGFGRLQKKLETEAFTLDRIRQEYVTRYIAVDYALGGAVSRRAIESAKGMDILGKIAMELANANVQERNFRIAAIFNNAFDSSAQPMADGASLVTTSGASVSGLNATNRLAVDAAFSEASLETMLIQIATNSRNTRGELLTITPEKLVVMPQEIYDCRRILHSTLRPGTADNDANVHSSLFSDKDIYTSPLLTDTNNDMWFILTDINRKGQGIKLKEARAFEIETDVDFRTSAVLVKGETSFIAGVTDRLCIYGTNGT